MMRMNDERTIFGCCMYPVTLVNIEFQIFSTFLRDRLTRDFQRHHKLFEIRNLLFCLDCYYHTYLPKTAISIIGHQTPLRESWK